MKTSEEFTKYVLDILSPLGRIETARMFGGVLLKVKGKQLGVLFRDTLYFKVIDKTLQERFKIEGSKQFTYTRKGKKAPLIIKNWWTIPGRTMDSSAEITALAEEILTQKNI